MQDDFRVYFEGKKLYGDDFTLKEIESWYSDEQEGYATLAQDKDKYINVFRDIILSTGFTIVKEQRTDHRITRKFKNIYQGYFKKSIYNSIIAMKFDRFFSRYFHINKQYYPFKKYRGPGAAGVFYVLSKSNS
jgi:hypothetical protein